MLYKIIVASEDFLRACDFSPLFCVVALFLFALDICLVQREARLYRLNLAFWKAIVRGCKPTFRYVKTWWNRSRVTQANKQAETSDNVVPEHVLVFTSPRSQCDASFGDWCCAVRDWLNLKEGVLVYRIFSIASPDTRYDNNRKFREGFGWYLEGRASLIVWPWRWHGVSEGDLCYSTTFVLPTFELSADNTYDLYPIILKSYNTVRTYKPFNIWCLVWVENCSW